MKQPKYNKKLLLILSMLLLMAWTIVLSKTLVFRVSIGELNSKYKRNTNTIIDIKKDLVRWNKIKTDKTYSNGLRIKNHQKNITSNDKRVDLKLIQEPISNIIKKNDSIPSLKSEIKSINIEKNDTLKTVVPQIKAPQTIILAEYNAKNSISSDREHSTNFIGTDYDYWDNVISSRTILPKNSSFNTESLRYSMVGARFEYDTLGRLVHSSFPTYSGRKNTLTYDYINLQKLFPNYSLSHNYKIEKVNGYITENYQLSNIKNIYLIFKPLNKSNSYNNRCSLDTLQKLTTAYLKENSNISIFNLNNSFKLDTLLVNIEKNNIYLEFEGTLINSDKYDNAAQLSYVIRNFLTKEILLQDTKRFIVPENTITFDQKFSTISASNYNNNHKTFVDTTNYHNLLKGIIDKIGELHKPQSISPSLVRSIPD